jgi:hypothetical protein
MCEVAIVRRAGHVHHCTTAGELGKALGCKPRTLPTTENSEPRRFPSWNDCLCPIDFNALARQRGLTLIHHGWDAGNSGEWELTDAAAAMENTA